MLRVPFVVFVCLLGAACGGPAAAVGTYTLDAPAFRARIGAQMRAHGASADAVAKQLESMMKVEGARRSSRRRRRREAGDFPSPPRWPRGQRAATIPAPQPECSMRWNLRCLLPVLVLAACGGNHPLAGNWAQELPGEQKGMSLELDVQSDKVFVHTAPREDGGHDHVSGTYTWDAKARSLTVHAKLAGDGKAETWTGTVDGEHMELRSADGKLEFHRGGAAHDH